VETIAYPYKPKTRMMFRGFFFFGAGAVILAFSALTNKKGLVINGLIHLDPQGATTFNWFMAAGCAVFAGLAFMLILFGRFSNQFLSLSETELSAPKWLLSPANTIVPVSSIQRLELKSVGQQHFLKVHHADGTLTITAANLPDAEAFAEVCAQLADLHLGPADGA
jgi:hypothetical protein